jgi:hypothetical protein
MDEDGIVSVWIGTAASIKLFEEALEVSFSGDGDFLGSPFSRAMGIGYYDEGLKEADYREASTRRLSELLQGVSYADLVVPRLSSLLSSEIEANCFVLLYNYRHMGPRTWNAEGVSLQYLGAVAYR